MRVQNNNKERKNSEPKALIKSAQQKHEKSKGYTKIIFTN